MADVYRQVQMGPDQLVGRVEEDGRVFESLFGPDRQVGKADAASGRVYRVRLGPDEYVGRVDAEGRIYRQVAMGPDQYIAHADKEGRIYSQVAMGPDQYVGHVNGMKSHVEAAAAYLLLLAHEE